MTVTNGRLAAKVAIVTGAGAGIGRAIAEVAHAEGAAVGVLDYDIESAKLVADALGANAHALQADIADYDAIDAAFTTVVDQFGKLDILFNVAGIFDLMEPMEAVPPSLWDRLFDINVRGTAYAMQRALQEMLPAGAGSIVNTSSTAAFIGGGGGSAYIASKGAIASLTRQVAFEVGTRGVRVNAIAPGPTMTNMVNHTHTILGSAESSDKARDLMSRVLANSGGNVILGRFADPVEIARPAVFLASDEASFMTGAVLVVDGGQSIH
jgi:NAD(P)-dependent dehydrogenase (short-subunit alcohol dehydrogenase family)